MSQNSVKPTFPDFRTFRTPHTRTRASSLNPAYIYMEIMMKKNTTRNEGLKGAFVGAHMCGVRNVRAPANPRKAYVCALLAVCGCRVRTQRSAHTTRPPQSCPRPAIFPASEKGLLFCLHDCQLGAIHTHARRCERRARFHRADPVGWHSFISSRVSRPLFIPETKKATGCKSCDTRGFPRLAEK